ncbi:MAG TPA: alpha/beta hydrolase, partial [Gammaproteobacteria bacterium]
FGVADPACKPYYWTHGRFAPEIAASMRAVVDTLLDRAAARDCVLVGHSGGAALALLIAPDLTHRCRIVTVAGLVDTAAWTQWQRYEPLDGSLNPADSIQRLAGIPQVHLLGARDRNIPPEQTKQALAPLRDAVVLEYETFDHGCCWERSWRAILRRIEGNGAATARAGAASD